METYEIIREENPPKIRQVLFHIDNSKKYLFDVNQNITINTLKKMLMAAASLEKVGIRIFHNGIEYTNKTTSTLEELFPNIQLVDFNLEITKEFPEDDEDLTKLKLKYYCSQHDGKYANFYCYNCNKSICNLCLCCGMHMNHKVKEKYDYLQSSKTLVEIMFQGLNEIFNNAKGFNEDNINNLKNKISNELFRQLNDILKQLENQIINLIEFYFKKQQFNFKILQKNYILLKNDCVEGLDKLKEEIDIEDMMVDDNVFKIFDTKFKEIESERERLEHDKTIFTQFSQILSLIQKRAESMFTEIYSVIQKYLETPEYNNIQQQIQNQTLRLIEKNEIIRKILSGIQKKDKNLFSKELKLSRKKVLKTAEKRDQITMTPMNLNNSNSKYNSNNYYVNQTITNPFTNNSNNQDFNANQQFMYNQNNNGINSKITIKSTSKYVTPIGKGMDSSSEDLINEENQTNEFRNEIINENEKIEHDQLFQYVSSVVIGAKKCIVFISKNNKIHRKKIDFSSLTGINNFLPECTWVNIDNKMYIQGGDDNSIPSKTFFLYDSIKNTFLRLNDSFNGHLSHSLFATNKFIYCIGGKTKLCERYNIENGTWQLLPNLLFIQQYPVLYIHNNYLYSFFGLNENGKEIDKIQRINLRNPKRYWENVPYIKNDCQLEMYGCGIIKLTNDIIYFIAGKDKNGVRSSVIEFNFSTFSASQTELHLEEKAYFKESILPKLGIDTYGNFTIEEINSFIKISFVAQ